MEMVRRFQNIIQHPEHLSVLLMFLVFIILIFDVDYLFISTNGLAAEFTRWPWYDAAFGENVHSSPPAVSSFIVSSKSLILFL